MVLWSTIPTQYTEDNFKQNDNNSVFQAEIVGITEGASGLLL